MRFLILGGTYFLGLAFTEQAFRAGHELTLINRGTHPIGHPRIREFHLDRHDSAALAALPAERFDAVIDFCGYAAGDIRSFLEAFPGTIGHYLFLSTVDACRRGTGLLLTEDAPLEDRVFPGEAGAYIAGKAALERELEACSAEGGFAFTVFRPSFIYGPGNYAPRESLYFHWIREAGQILHPSDATGHFQFVYVEDAARAVLESCRNPEAYGRRLFLACEEEVTYERWAVLLKGAVDRPFTMAELPVSEVTARGIPLPFPLTEEESERCDGKFIRQILPNFSYLPMEEGLRFSWQAAQV
ncbi:MAG: NAD-dependent epimerase/dehydratase family protein [Lachnospiraceae bacterium]|nr:NAD-dependent epimerase/dehydratase family protein [Lachnospiraceae bacterium]